MVSVCFNETFYRALPSSIPSPERRMGTREMVLGEIVVVV